MKIEPEFLKSLKLPKAMPYKWVACTGFLSKKWAGVKISHTPVWVCTPIFNRDPCPVCRSPLKWATEYSQVLGESQFGKTLNKEL